MESYELVDKNDGFKLNGLISTDAKAKCFSDAAREQDISFAKAVINVGVPFQNLNNATVEFFNDVKEGKIGNDLMGDVDGHHAD